MVNTIQVKKEFDNLTKGIARLESLRHELDIMDTTCFETEARLIRAKLHDVNAVHEIERDIKKLQKKILKKHKQKECKPVCRQKNEVSLNRAGTEFINEIKDELEEQVKEEKQFFAKKYKEDVNLKKKDLEAHYRELDKRLNESYESKLQEELNRKVTEKLDEEVLKRLAEEKKKIVENEIKADSKRLASEKKLIVDRLEKEYIRKKQELMRALNDKERSELSKIASTRNAITEQAKLLSEKEKLFRIREASMTGVLKKEKAALENKLARLREHEDELASEKTKLENKKKVFYNHESYEKAIHDTDIKLISKLKLYQHKLEKNLAAEKKQEALEHEELEKYVKQKKEAREELEKKEKELADALEKEKEAHQQDLQSLCEIRKRQANIRKKLEKIRKEQEQKTKLNVGKHENELAKDFSDRVTELTGALSKLKEKEKRALAQNRLMKARASKIRHALITKLHLMKQKHEELARKLSVQRHKCRSSLEARLNLEKERIKHELEALNSKKKQITDENKTLKLAIEIQRSEAKEKTARLEMSQKAAINAMKRSFKREIAKEKRKLEENFENKLVMLKKKSHKELAKKIASTAKGNSGKIARLLKRKETEIKTQAIAQYKKELQIKLNEKEAELQKKKEEMRKYIMQRAKKLLNFK